MRAFFGLLLLLNIALFAWQYQARGGLADRDIESGDFRSTDPGVTPLTLLSERPAVTGTMPATVAEAVPLATAEAQSPLQNEDEPSEMGHAGPDVGENTEVPLAEEQEITLAAPEPAPAGITAVGRRCLELGPSTDRAAVEQIAAAAQQAGARAVMREGAPTVAGGYWVRLPEYFTFAEARAKYRELQQKGVDDVAIVPLPDKRYFISLGVYKKKDTVEERRDEILAKGVTPVIEDRAQAGISYTVEVEYAGADPRWVVSLQGALSAQSSQIALREVECH